MDLSILRQGQKVLDSDGNKLIYDSTDHIPPLYYYFFAENGKVFCFREDGIPLSRILSPAITTILPRTPTDQDELKIYKLWGW